MTGASSEPRGADGAYALTRDQILCWLRLCLLPGIGPRTLTALEQRFGDAEAVLAAGVDELAGVNGVGPRLAAAIQNASHYVAAESILAQCEQDGTAILFRGSPDYPAMLRDLDDAPPILFSRGRLRPCDQLAIAIVGTRHATPYGRKQAERFGYLLARAGMTIVSGLARGIDAAAHKGALDAEGRTLAILGGGINQLYPPEHRQLADQIARRGAVISEYAPDAKPRSGMFPQRNRLIAALSVATLVIEAPTRSGALITARLAAEQNRDVMALPGPITSRASHGSNDLIRQGALLVQSIDDILEGLGPLVEPVTTEGNGEICRPAELTLNEIEKQVLAAVSQSAVTVDQVIEQCSLPAHRVQSILTVLEMRQLVRRISGNRVVRASAMIVK